MRVAAVLVLTLLAAGCGNADCPPPGTAAGVASGAARPGPAHDGDPGEVVAEVGDVVVTADEFKFAAQRAEPKDGTALDSEERRQILQGLIDDKVLYQEALRERIDQDPKVQKLMIQTLMRKKVYADVRNADITEEELRKYYEEHREDFLAPEKVQARRILIKPGRDMTDAQAKKLAADIRQQLNASPDKFKALALEHSKDAYRKRGGDMGLISREGKPGVDSVVVEEAFKLQIGQISPVFQTDDGYNIVGVTNRREETERTFDQMRSSVLRRVKNEKFEQLYRDYVDGKRNDYPVEVFADELDRVVVEPRRFGRAEPLLGRQGDPEEGEDE